MSQQTEYNSDWDDPDAHNGEFPPDWQARCQGVFKRDAYTCANCGWQDPTETEVTHNDHRELHGKHIIPVAEGGTNELSNIATVCGECYSPPAEQSPLNTTSVASGETQGVGGIVSVFDMWGVEDESYTIRKAILRVSLSLALFGIIIVFAYQLAIGVHSFFNGFTKQHPGVVYGSLIGVCGLFGVGVYRFGEAVVEVDQSPGETQETTVQLGVAGAVVSLLLAAVVQFVFPPIGSGNGIVTMISLGVLSVVFGVSAVVMLIGVVVGSLDVRYKLGEEIHPAVWSVAAVTPVVLFVWMWLLGGVPYDASEVVRYTLPVIGRVSRGMVLDVLAVSMPVVGAAYALRARLDA